MVWGNNTGGINSTSLDNLREYMTRPTDAVLEFLAGNSRPIIIYGATGKWMADFTEMFLRGLQETHEDSSESVHLVSRFSNPRKFQSRFGRYNNSFTQHALDATTIDEKDLTKIPKEGIVFYGIGYKFRQGNTSDEEYARLCDQYGNRIPFVIFSYHRENSEIVVMGSGNGLRLTSLDKPSTEDAQLEPADGNHYGASIRDKERTLKEVLSGRSSRAVVLRGMYFTDLTYGALEKPIRDVFERCAIDLSHAAFFNILSHRDVSIYTLLSVLHTSNPLQVLNVAGSIADKE